MPGGSRLTDFTITAARCQCLAENGVTRTVEPRGSMQVRVQPDDAAETTAQEDRTIWRQTHGRPRIGLIGLARQLSRP